MGQAALRTPHTSHWGEHGKCLPGPDHEHRVRQTSIQRDALKNKWGRPFKKEKREKKREKEKKTGGEKEKQQQQKAGELFYL